MHWSPLFDSFISYICFRTSATNCAHIYSTTFGTENALPRGWQFTATLQQEHISDAFELLSLLEDHAKHNTILHVPNSGPQDEQFDKAKSVQTERIRMHGQDEINHLCKKCVREYVLEDGSTLFPQTENTY